MINFQRIFGEPESREDKLRRMWTRIYEADQLRKQEELNQDEVLTWLFNVLFNLLIKLQYKLHEKNSLRKPLSVTL